VLTPNGDGIHERVEITYALFRLPEEAPVELSVFTLSGLQVVKLSLGDQRAGSQRVFWDGRDADGRLLLPGIYVLGITLQSETDTHRQLRPLGIAY
jgi:flagellar hook assembly protein FlgD